MIRVACTNLRTMVVLATMVAVALAMLIVILSDAPANEQRVPGTTFAVNPTAEAPDSDTTDNVCDTGVSTEGALCTLRAAIEQDTVGALYQSFTVQLFSYPQEERLRLRRG